MKSWLCEWLLSCALALPAAVDIEELHYGRLLYAYYQADYQQALVLALQAEHRGWRAQQPIRYTMAEGSFAFAQGMYDFAADRFALLDDAQLSPLDQQRLSFHLSREYLRRGDYQRLAAQLTRFDLPEGRVRRAEVHPEVAFMQVELALYQQQLPLARQWLERMPADDPYTAYARFNYAVARHGAGDHAQALQQLLSLSGQRSPDEAVRDLQQQAAVAAVMLIRQDPELLAQVPTARGQSPLEALQHMLPGSGRHRDAALAHYAELVMRVETPRAAEPLWRHLQAPNDQAHAWQPEQLLSWLALPMSLEQQQRGPAALAAYEQAEAVLVARVEQLGALQQQLASPDAVARLLAELSTRPRQALSPWQAQLGHRQLLSWLAEPRLHALVSEWQELNDASRWLTTLPQQLDAWSEIAVEQQRRAGDAAALLQAQRLPERADELGQQLARWSERLDMAARQRPAIDDSWFEAMADQEQRALAARLARLRQIAERGLDGAEQARALARIDRLQGLLLWELQEQQPVLVQQLRSEGRGLGSAHLDTQQRLAFVATAEADFRAGVGADFAALQARVARLDWQLAEARLQRESVLAAALRDRLQQEAQQVTHYLAQVRLGRARVLDALLVSEVSP
jgi:hypothetical protein